MTSAWYNYWSDKMTEETGMNNILDELAKQSQNVTPQNFICQNCKNHKGGCGCEQNMFIAFNGANTSVCQYYETGRKCPHCGRIV